MIVWLVGASLLKFVVSLIGRSKLLKFKDSLIGGAKYVAQVSR